MGWAAVKEHPLTGAIGAEITGVDLRQAIDPRILLPSFLGSRWQYGQIEARRLCIHPSSPRLCDLRVDGTPDRGRATKASATRLSPMQHSEQCSSRWPAAGSGVDLSGLGGAHPPPAARHRRERQAMEEFMANMDDLRIDHTGIGVSDIVRSKMFYDAALGALGLRAVVCITTKFEVANKISDSALGGVGYGATFPIFWIDVFHAHGTKHHTAFRARSREEVQAFHGAALSAGGQDNGEPGLRAGRNPPGYYAAFVFDPDGNNIEAVFRES